MGQQKVLIVEDETDFANLVARSLERAGYKTVICKTGASALLEARSNPPDCILLDWMLPDMPGTEVLRRLKTEAKTAIVPVIFVTARGEEVDRVVGLELGADDYVVKPVSLRELALRIGAVLRRRLFDPSTDRQIGPEEIRVSSLYLNRKTHRAFVEGDELNLSALEFRVLWHLASNRGRVFSREELLDKIWGIQNAIETRTVDVTVKRLRDKLGKFGALIETVRGVGYRFSEQEKV